MQNDIRKKLDEIRRRFVGSGEEHELLARISSEYSTAYERGASDREAYWRESREYDADAIKFANELCSLTYEVRNFITARELQVGQLSEVADWLKRNGKTPALLRKIADEMEREPAHD